MLKDFEILVDIYSKPDKKGVQKLLKKNMVLLRQMDTEDLDVSQYVNDNGTISKKYSLLIDRSNTSLTYKFNMNYNKAKLFLKDKDIHIKGYIRY